MEGRLRAARAALVAGFVVMLAFAAWAPSALAGVPVKQPVAPLTVVKTVSGPVPEGTTFTAKIECDGEIIEGDSELVDSVEITFDATGQPTSEDTFGFDNEGTCTVTETEDGGAETKTYACDVDFLDSGATASQVDPVDICPDAGPQSDPITVNIEVEDQDVTVTIANTFVAPATTTTTAPAAPQAAPAVVAPARFTG
jgi:hypothetical protein